ncbi:MAG TPA: hypothetical protein VN842_05345 [Thermoplasmata archaeon]|nr:hypothetical protein [Thermoplasmata archaeon]
MAVVVTGGRSRAWVELSGENRALARAELTGAIGALGGQCLPSGKGENPPGPEFVAVELEGEEALADLAGRMALARRILRLFPEPDLGDLEARFLREGGTGRSAAFRPLSGSGRSGITPNARRLAGAFRSGGGSIDLEHPDRRFWIEEVEGRKVRAFEEIGAVDRTSFEARRMPRLPYQRPVSLAPRLGRVAANLAQVRIGDEVVDPFVGTGALLLEAGLLGARVSGVDRSAEMVRGALRNLGRFGVHVARVAVADAAEAFDPDDARGWAAVLTDPPYGRASGTGGEPPEALLKRILPLWADRVRPGGRVVVVVPGGPDPLPAPWVRSVSVPDRVHRSLTREFRVYRRAGERD